MSDNKPVEEMTEQEAKEYCEEFIKEGEGERNFVERSLKDGDTYRQIAFFLRESGMVLDSHDSQRQITAVGVKEPVPVTLESRVKRETENRPLSPLIRYVKGCRFLSRQ